MTKWPRPDWQSLTNFYGNPDSNRDGQPDRGWEVDNLTYIVPPYPMFWSWSMEPVRKIRIHKKCANSLMIALSRIKENHTPDEIKTFELNQCGGGYNFRLMRGGNALSMHAYGCAIDLATSINYLGRVWEPEKGMMPSSVVKIFEDEGWTFGGRWVRGDAQHFEATSLKS